MKSHGQIVWIYGSSATGKETFIRKVIKEKPQELLSTLHWTEGKIVPCMESIEWVAQSDDDPLKYKRETLLKIIPSLVKNGDEIVLIKGQDVDLENDCLTQVQSKLPNLKHLVIFLDTPLDQLFKRWRMKSWWSDNFTKETVKKWLEYQISLLNQLPESFDIIALEVNLSGNYHIVVYPPVLK